MCGVDIGNVVDTIFPGAGSAGTAAAKKVIPKPKMPEVVVEDPMKQQLELETKAAQEGLAARKKKKALSLLSLAAAGAGDTSTATTSAAHATGVNTLGGV